MGQSEIESPSPFKSRNIIGDAPYGGYNNIRLTGRSWRQDIIRGGYPVVTYPWHPVTRVRRTGWRTSAVPGADP